MLKKRLGIEAIERDWAFDYIYLYFKIPSTFIIPEGCKMIGRYAFNGCWGLKKVIISESVERIGIKAFWKCRNAVIILKKPESVEEIEEDALFWCDVLVEEKDVKEKTRD